MTTASGPSATNSTAKDGGYQGPPGKLYYLALWRNEKDPPVELCAETDLTQFGRFTRGTILEFMQQIVGKEWSKRTRGQNYVMEQPDPDQQFIVHAESRSEGICCIAITSDDVQRTSGAQLIRHTLNQFTSKYPKTTWASAATVSYPGLKKIFEDYKQPNKANQLLGIQAELDATHGILQNTIHSVLERGEKIDNLVQKSDGLSAQSKMFYTQAKKQNSCCTVM